jgi:formylglycine-generating enzyme required for sulfatase activity
MRLLIAILTLVLLAAYPACAEKRVALVIGNAAYKNAATLQNPKNDATDVSEALKRLGFETIVGLDLNKDGMEEKSIAFARAARDADVALVYYSGHAMQFGGFNYLMPVDAALHDEADLRRLTRVDEIVADLKQAKNLRILVLDACRDNPLADELSRSMEGSRGLTVDRGLARIIPPSGMIISYATQAGRTAADGRGRNSPYTMAFLKDIEATEEIGTVFRNITSDVYTATESKQLPELSLSLIGNFYLKGRPEAVTGVQPTNEAAQAWAATQATTSQAVLEDFVRQFGNTPYGSMARARLEELKKSQVAVVAPPVAAVAPTFSPRSCGAPLTVLTVSLLSRSAQPLSAAEECALKPKDLFKECDKCPEMVVIPAGSFTMGSPPNEEGRLPGEEPQHTVTISHAFAAGKFTVTVDQFAEFVKETGYDAGSKCWTFEDGKSEERIGRSFANPGFSQSGSHPAVCVSSNDAKAYVAWLSKKMGKPYRLLTEAEWEYAARGRTKPGSYPRYFFGDNKDDMCRYGNAWDQIAASKIPGGNADWFVHCADGYIYTAPVGSFLPNAFGLYDMHGNAWQWVEDCWHDNYYGAPNDGSAWTTSGDCGRRTRRGGSWYSVSGTLRAASRGAGPTDDRDSNDGFRVARTLSP